MKTSNPPFAWPRRLGLRILNSIVGIRGRLPWKEFVALVAAAVGNPKLDNEIVFEGNTQRNIGYASEHLYLDKDGYRDGYGILVISPDRNTATFECWPGRPSTEQHPGWPVVLRKYSES